MLGTEGINQNVEHQMVFSDTNQEHLVQLQYRVFEVESWLSSQFLSLLLNLYWAKWCVFNPRAKSPGVRTDSLNCNARLPLQFSLQLCNIHQAGIGFASAPKKGKYCHTYFTVHKTPWLQMKAAIIGSYLNPLNDRSILFSIVDTDWQWLYQISDRNSSLPYLERLGIGPWSSAYKEHRHMG